MMSSYFVAGSFVTQWQSPHEGGETQTRDDRCSGALREFEASLD